MSISGPLLTYQELAERWGVAPRTIYRWAKTGVAGTEFKLNPVRLGRTVRIRLATVVAIEAQAGDDEGSPRRRRRRRAAA